MNASREVLTALREKGYRVTRVRKELITTLASLREPLTILELAEHVDADPVSVYRNIALLLKLGHIEEIAERGKDRRYALAGSHHHHIICTNCGYVTHIPCSDRQKFRVHHKHFSVIESHDVTFYGRCHSCI